MKIIVREVSKPEYGKLTAGITNKLPLWLIPRYADVYEDDLLLAVYQGLALVGLWVVPLIKQNNSFIAKRNYRFFPYMSPYLLVEDNLKRREIIHQLFLFLQERVTQVSLPFAPDFFDFASIQGRGGFVEWRHTHKVDSMLTLEKLTSRLRNHIVYAKKHVHIVESTCITDFDFNLAIKGSFEERISRSALAKQLFDDNKAIILSAYKDEEISAGIFIVYHDKTAYLFHSWQKANTPRGTISWLIFSGVKELFERKAIKVFDFEGSILQSIDYFFSGFNAQITPYGHVLWSRDPENMNILIKNSINIPGRLTE